MSYEFLKDPTFLEKRKNKKSHFIPNPGLDLPTWDDVISEINRSIKEKSDMRQHDNGFFVLIEGYKVKYAQRFLEEYSKLSPTMYPTAHCYIALSEESWGLGKHHDSADVIYWQLIGKTQWTVEEINDGKIEQITYTLSPGDIVYVPMEMYHTVKNLTPRAAISFGLENQ